jgi:hypothetical protein
LLPLEPHTAIPDLLVVADPHDDGLRDLIPVIHIFLFLVATSPPMVAVLILVKLPELVIIEDLLSLIFLRVRDLCDLGQVNFRRCIYILASLSSGPLRVLLLLLHLLHQLLLLHRIILEVIPRYEYVLSLFSICIGVPSVLVLDDVLQDVRVVKGGDFREALESGPLHVGDPGQLLPPLPDQVLVVLCLDKVGGGLLVGELVSQVGGVEIFVLGVRLELEAFKEELIEPFVQAALSLQDAEGQEKGEEQLVLFEDGLAYFPVEGEGEVPDDVKKRVLVGSLLLIHLLCEDFNVPFQGELVHVLDL